MENDLLLILCGEYNYTTLCQHCGTVLPPMASAVDTVRVEFFVMQH